MKDCATTLGRGMQQCLTSWLPKIQLKLKAFELQAVHSLAVITLLYSAKTSPMALQ